MARSRQNTRTPPRALIPAGSSGSTPRSPNPSADHKAALRVIGLAVLIHMLRSRRLYELTALAAIVLAALTRLAGLDKESRAKALARLVAWLKEEDEHLERKIDTLT